MNGMQARFRYGGLVASVAVLGFAIACSGDDDDGTSTPGTSGSGGGVTAEAGTLHGLDVVNPACGTGDGGLGNECASCTAASCGSEYATCFGSGWATSLVGGVCSTFGQCVTDCGCGDNECFQACLDGIEGTPGDDCYGCLANLFTCEQASCADECADEATDAGTQGKDGGKPDH